MLRQYVEQRVDTVVYRRVDELFRDGHRRGLPAATPDLQSESTRCTLERLPASGLPRELDRTAAGTLRLLRSGKCHAAAGQTGAGSVLANQAQRGFGTVGPLDAVVHDVADGVEYLPMAVALWTAAPAI
ncbi:hypothetical protein, partial [Streptomyces sp900116325]|uniref:hypothetical protein n=1 Tax=Streptomyces sp. 900116325 TaxID=3154295 RepID=UPI0033BC9FF5